MIDKDAAPVFNSIDKVFAFFFRYCRTALIFPDASYRVADWGQVVNAGTDFSVDARIEQIPGVAIQVVTTTAQIFSFGTLNSGTYSFTFKSSEATTCATS